jgi:hypothetical protein
VALPAPQPADRVDEVEAGAAGNQIELSAGQDFIHAAEQSL